MKTMTNNEIYAITIALNREFEDTKQVLPVKVNFYIQKNKATLTSLAQDIEKARMDVLQQYGSYNEETEQFEFTAEQAPILTRELNDLFSLEQEVNIYTVDIEKFGDDLSLTTGQMEALMFMID
jgi:uncharacterized circularly permuted ATP-grasp superfamily protein